MPILYASSPEVQNSIEEALKRTMSKHDLALAIAAHECGRDYFSAASKDSEDEVRAKEIRLAGRLARENDAPTLVKKTIEIMNSHSFCEPGGSKLYIDEQGKYLLDMDELHMLKLGDIIREADYHLTEGNVGLIAEHFDLNIGWRLQKIIPDNAGDKIMQYPLSNRKGSIQFEVFSKDGVTLDLETDNKRLRHRWDSGVKEWAEQALQSRLSRLSPQAGGILAFKAEAGNPEALDNYSMSYS